MNHVACIQIGRPGDIAPTEVEARTLAERLGRFDVASTSCIPRRSAIGCRRRSRCPRGGLSSRRRGERCLALGGGGVFPSFTSGVETGWSDRGRRRSRTSRGYDAHGFGWSMDFSATLDNRRAALDLLERHSAELPRGSTIHGAGGPVQGSGGWWRLASGARGGTVSLVREGMATGTVVTFDRTTSSRQWLASRRHQAAIGRQPNLTSHARWSWRRCPSSERAESRYWFARMKPNVVVRRCCIGAGATGCGDRRISCDGPRGT